MQDNEFEPNAPVAIPQNTMLAAREQSEIQSAIISAKKFPRDEHASYLKITKSFSRASLAESAVWSFPRGGKKVEGPSIHAARELARCWGNVTYGLRVVDVDDTYVHIKGRALDLESNTCVEAEDKFEKKVQRRNKATGISEWIVVSDERDLRELINRRGAILVRNCILQVIPPDVVEDAIAQASKTYLASIEGSLKTNREDTVRQLVIAFSKLGVSTVMLEEYLGHKLDLITHHQLLELQTIFNSIRDGNSKRDEIFNLGAKSRGAAELNGLGPVHVPGDIVVEIE